MGFWKQKMIEESEAAEAEAQAEIVDECDFCGADVSAGQVNKMPFDGGKPAFVMCLKCEREGTEDMVRCMKAPPRVHT